MQLIKNDWDDILREDFSSDWYAGLREFLKKEYREQTIFPDMWEIYSALKTTSYKDAKVVILGQDPYHTPGAAHGLCFSVQPHAKIPPSLVNIFKELNADLGIPIPSNGHLLRWAEQGVLLLNTILTVRQGMPLSHKNKGWEKLTDSVIRALNDRDKPVIFLLWGANARSKKELITNEHHYILETSHPSPLSAYYGFLGCRHFSKTNQILSSLGETEINW